MLVMLTAIEAHMNANENDTTAFNFPKDNFVKNVLQTFQAVQQIPIPERNVFEQCQKSKNCISGDE